MIEICAFFQTLVIGFHHFITAFSKNDVGVTRGSGIYDRAIFADGDSLRHISGAAGHDRFISCYIVRKPIVNGRHDLIGIVGIFFHTFLHIRVDDNGFAAWRDIA